MQQRDAFGASEEHCASITRKRKRFKVQATDINEHFLWREKVFRTLTYTDDSFSVASVPSQVDDSKVLQTATGKAMSHLTLRSLTLYIYGAPILDVSRSHTTTQHSR